MFIVSCDPGITGAVAAIKNGELYEVFPIPLTSDRRVDIEQLTENIADLSQDEPVMDIRCCVEFVHAMPKQGVSSLFRFGYTTGILTGILGAILYLDPDTIRPQDWKKHWGLSGTAKDAAVSTALELEPALFDSFLEDHGKYPNKQLQSGMADAYLMGMYYYSTLVDVN